MNVFLELDSRIRVALSTLPSDAEEALRAAFTHPNPAYQPNTLAGTGEPPSYETFRVVPAGDVDSGEDDYLTLPRGGMERVRQVLRSFSCEWTVDDQRTWKYPEPGFPGQRKTLRPYQTEMVEAGAMAQNCLLVAPTGCITGDAKIGLNRAGKGFTASLEHVVKMFNGGIASGRRWEPHIPTYVRAPFKDGTVRLAHLLDAYPSGVKPVYEVRTADGNALVLTECHRFQTSFGWRPLAQLRAGDYLLRDGGIPTGKSKGKSWYRMRVCRSHPFAGRKNVSRRNGGWTVPLHRLVAEARINGMELEEFLRAVDRKDLGLQFLDPVEWVVHHVDEDALNNAPSNLEVVTHAEHAARHVGTSMRNICARLEPVQITNIAYVGERETYDLEVKGVHAFTANGIAVHNSGKTTALLGLLAKLKRRAIVQVWTGNLLEQWRERCIEELGFEPGILQGSSDGGHPWLDLAMQQTIVSRFERGDLELAHRYDVVLCDEVQRFAAPTLFASVDPFTARYRIGASADYTRKDGKEFLTRDLFGRVAYEVKEAELIEAGAIVEVEICVVPTQFKAHWYRIEGGPGAFHRLLQQMTGDEERNEIALGIAQREMDAGEQVLLFSHRIEHARSIDAELVARGYRSGVMLGGPTQVEVFERTKRGLKSKGDDRKMAGVGTYQAIAQGLDLPSVSRGVCMTPIGNNLQQMGQTKGRLCRSSSGKDAGRLYYLHDRHVYGRRVIENLIKRFRVRALWNGEWIDGAEYVRQLRMTA